LLSRVRACNSSRPLYLEPNRRLIEAKYDFAWVLVSSEEISPLDLRFESCSTQFFKKET